MTSSLEYSYPHTPYRVEYRPVYAPHSQDELLSVLDQLSACGVRAWWYGVATKGGYPFFASRHLPHSENTVDYLPWLVEQAHERGKGRAVYAVPNIAADDAQWGPKEAARETYARLLLPHLLLPFTTDAPPDVLVTLWEQADKRVFHLLKLPANCRALPWYEHDPWPPEVIVSEDQPVAPIRIRLRDEGEAVSPVTEVGIRVQRSHQTMHIELDGFVTHASIVLSRPLDEATI